MVVHSAIPTIESIEIATNLSTMFLKAFVLLHCASLVFGAPAKGFNVENPLNIAAGGPAFVALDNGVNSYFQTDGNFVIYGRGTVNTADALWYTSTVCLPKICCVFFYIFRKSNGALCTGRPRLYAQQLQANFPKRRQPCSLYQRGSSVEHWNAGPRIRLVLYESEAIHVHP